MTEFIPAEWQKTLKERREKIGILQADFAVLAGVSVSHYREIESGRHEATARMRDKIEHGFDLLQPNPLYMLIDYVKIRFKTTNAKYVIEKVLKINMKYMTHDKNTQVIMTVAIITVILRSFIHRTKPMALSLN